MSSADSTNSSSATNLLVEEYVTMLLPHVKFGYDEELEKWYGVLVVQGKEVKQSICYESTEEESKQEFPNWISEWVELCLKLPCRQRFLREIIEPVQCKIDTIRNG